MSQQKINAKAHRGPRSQFFQSLFRPFYTHILQKSNFTSSHFFQVGFYPKAKFFKVWILSYVRLAFIFLFSPKSFYYPNKLYQLPIFNSFRPVIGSIHYFHFHNSPLWNTIDGQTPILVEMFHLKA